MMTQQEIDTLQQRYNKLKSLSVPEFKALYMQNILKWQSFDVLLDEFIILEE